MVLFTEPPPPSRVFDCRETVFVRFTLPRLMLLRDVLKENVRTRVCSFAFSVSLSLCACKPDHHQHRPGGRKVRGEREE